MASNSDILQTLLSIETMAKHLSESHLSRQYENKEQGPILAKLIDTAFRHLEQCVDILRPCALISRLPKEIFGLIFHAAQDEDWATAPSEEQSISIPLTLSQVSQSWRDVTIDLPLLWTTLKISWPWKLQSIETILSMSEPLPIELKITDLRLRKGWPWDEDEDTEVEGEKAKAFCELLASHIPRCRSIFITTDTDFPYLYLEMLDQFKDVDALQLKTLSIVSQGYNTQYDPQILFDSAPLLSDLRLNAPSLIHGHPPLDHITSLYLKGDPNQYYRLRGRNLFNALSQCPVLGELHLYDEVLSNWTESTVAIHSLSALRTLHFYGVTGYTRGGVLCRMEAPLLDHILFAPFSHRDTFVEKFLAVYGPVTQRFPSLRTLSLTTNDDSGNWFGDVGVYFAGIEILILGGASGGLMSGSLAGDERARFLPNLQILSLQDLTEQSGDELCNFITLRKAAGVSLPKILLDAPSLANMRHLDWLKTQVELTEREPSPDQFERANVFDRSEGLRTFV